jgi:hypothetical protein
MSNEYYTYSELIGFGFSKKLILQKFPDPILKQNPIYKNAAPMKLYKKDDVDEYINTKEFQTHLEKRKKRVSSSLSSAAARKQNTINYINSILDEIKIEKININSLRRLTLENKKEWFFEQNDYLDETFVDDTTMKRWMINYVRHVLTNYDYILSTIKGKFGVSEAYILFKEKINNKIREIYPELFE